MLLGATNGLPSLREKRRLTFRGAPYRRRGLYSFPGADQNTGVDTEGSKNVRQDKGGVDPRDGTLRLRLVGPNHSLRGPVREPGGV